MLGGGGLPFPAAYYVAFSPQMIISCGQLRVFSGRGGGTISFSVGLFAFKRGENCMSYPDELTGISHDNGHHKIALFASGTCQENSY